MKNEIKFFVYILFSKSYRRFYVGMSSDVNRRLKEHNLLKVLSTKDFAPWVVGHIDEYSSRDEARKRENISNLPQGVDGKKTIWGISSAG